MMLSSFILSLHKYFLHPSKANYHFMCVPRLVLICVVLTNTHKLYVFHFCDYDCEILQNFLVLHYVLEIFPGAKYTCVFGISKYCMALPITKTPTCVKDNRPSGNHWWLTKIINVTDKKFLVLLIEVKTAKKVRIWVYFERFYSALITSEKRKQKVKLMPKS